METGDSAHWKNTYKATQLSGYKIEILLNLNSLLAMWSNLWTPFRDLICYSRPESAGLMWEESVWEITLNIPDYFGVYIALNCS